MQVVLECEGTMNKLYGKEVEDAQGSAPDGPAPVTRSPPPDNVTPTPTPQESDLNTPREQEITEHSAPSGTVELATRPATFPGHPEIYSKKDIEKEKELAGIDFYNSKTKEGLDIVLIPKTYSTSPGINIHSVRLPAGTSHLGYAASHTGKAHSSGDNVIAKYKQSIPTHFTSSPSIIGYYHL